MQAEWTPVAIVAGFSARRIQTNSEHVSFATKAHRHKAFLNTLGDGQKQIVLDNLLPDIRSAAKRPDLAPVYSFNAEGMWLERMKGKGIRMGNPNKLDLWTDLRIRMNELGMDL